MKPVIVEHTNTNFTAPGCLDLPGTRVQNPDGSWEVETVWELSEEDMKRVQRDHLIYLLTRGTTVPPMALSTEDMLMRGDQNG